MEKNIIFNKTLEDIDYNQPEKLLYLNNKFKEMNRELCYINKNATNEDLEETIKSNQLINYKLIIYK
jgi:hypothetical protein